MIGYKWNISLREVFNTRLNIDQECVKFMESDQEYEHLSQYFQRSNPFFYKKSFCDRFFNKDD